MDRTREIGFISLWISIGEESNATQCWSEHTTKEKKKEKKKKKKKKKHQRKQCWWHAYLNRKPASRWISLLTNIFRPPFTTKPGMCIRCAQNQERQLHQADQDEQSRPHKKKMTPDQTDFFSAEHDIPVLQRTLHTDLPDLSRPSRR
jgi:hypothetical protein